MALWCDSFAPTSISQIVEQKAALKTLEKNLTSRPLLIVGPSGVGKSLAAKCLLCNYKAVEVNPSIEHQENEIDKFFKYTYDSKLFQFALLVEEADYLDSKALSSLNKYLKQSKFKHPIIIICNQCQLPALRTMKNYVDVVYFNRISDEGIFEHLKAINKKTGKKYTKKSELNGIVTSANGDLRHAVNLMQMGVPISGKDTNSSISDNLFDLGKVLMTKKTSDCDIKKDVFMSMNLIHENCYRQKYSISDKAALIKLSKLSENLSIVDLLNTIYATDYEASILCLNCNRLQNYYESLHSHSQSRINFPGLLGMMSSASANLKNQIQLKHVLGHTDKYRFLQVILVNLRVAKQNKNTVLKKSIETLLKSWLRPLNLTKDCIELFQKPEVGSKISLPAIGGLLKK